MSELKINAALMQAAKDAIALVSPAIPNSHVAYEAKDFKPPNQARWASVFSLPADSPPASLGKGGQDEHVGVLQIDINDVANIGTAPFLKAADSIRDHFKAGARFIYQGQCVVITSSSRGRIRPVDGWLRCSLSIAWSAMTTR